MEMKMQRDKLNQERMKQDQLNMNQMALKK